MNQADFTSTLEKYVSELSGILSRFKKTREGIWIADEDEGRYREICLELMDFFHDEVVDGTVHSKLVAKYFNESVQNYVGSPSYRGVENVRGVAKAVLARVIRSSAALRGTAIAAPQSTASDRVEALYRIGGALSPCRETDPQQARGTCDP